MENQNKNTDRPLDEKIKNNDRPSVSNLYQPTVHRYFGIFTDPCPTLFSGLWYSVHEASLDANGKACYKAEKNQVTKRLTD